MNSSADVEEVCYLEKNNQFVNKNDVLAKKINISLRKDLKSEMDHEYQSYAKKTE